MDYESLVKENVEEYGRGERHLWNNVELYSSRAHFLFELLQNAEDAAEKRYGPSGEGRVVIKLFDDRIEFLNNGEPFSESNVRSICGVSTSDKPAGSVGKFGIGFKSVYAYTLRPEVHSGSFHFRIDGLIKPHKVDPPIQTEDEFADWTKFILPFDLPTDTRKFGKPVPAEKARDEILAELQTLSTRTVLFLRGLTDVSWHLPSGISDSIRLERLTVPSTFGRVELVGVTKSGKTEQWLVLGDGKVEVAFLVVEGKIRKALDTELVVKFPTSRITGLGFLVQAPFATTPARDDILRDTDDFPENLEYLELASNLAAGSVQVARDLGMLDLRSFDAFPLDRSVFQDKSKKQFEVFFERFHEILSHEDVWPSESGKFLSVGRSRLARGQKLTEYFTPEILRDLYARPLDWLTTAITKDRTPIVHDYLLSIDPKVEVTLEGLEKELTATFLERRSAIWLASFLTYVDSSSSRLLQSLPVVRLTNGKHVTAREAFLPTEGILANYPTTFPTVSSEVLELEGMKQFHRDRLNVREPQPKDVVNRAILPRYAGGCPADWSEYLSDFQWLVDAARLDRSVVEACRRVRVLAGIPAAGDGHLQMRSPSERVVFPSTPELRIWFEGNSDFYFIHPDIANIEGYELVAFENHRDYSDSPLSHLCTVPWNRVGKVQITAYKIGLDGFDPNANLIGLKHVLAHPSLECSSLLWSMLRDIPKLLHGSVKQGNNASNLDRENPTEVDSILGSLCKKNAWLPSPLGVWSSPDKLFPSELPESYAPGSMDSRLVAEGLGMKSEARDQAFKEISGGDKDKEELLRRVSAGTPEFLEKVCKLIEHVPKPSSPQQSFKERLQQLSRPPLLGPSHDPEEFEGFDRGAPRNPSYYQGRIDHEIADRLLSAGGLGRPSDFAVSMRRPLSREVKEFLYQEYQGRCQLSHTTFLKARGGNYFEVWAFTESLDQAGACLCVSAENQARLSCGSLSGFESDKLSEIVEGFRRHPTPSVSLSIVLCGEIQTVTWTQRHFHRFVALYDLA